MERSFVTFLCVTSLVYVLQQLKQQDSRLGEQTSIIAALKLELEKTKKESQDAVREQARIQKEFDANRALMLDLERAERMVRVDLEQGSKRVRLITSLWLFLRDKRAARMSLYCLACRWNAFVVASLV